MKSVTKTEMRFGIHYPYMIDGNDCHLVKLVHTYDDNTQSSEIKIIENFMVPYWVTKERYRNHKQTKSWEEERKLQKRETTRIDMVKNIGRTLRFRRAKSLRELFSSPYLYGANISSLALLKNKYNNGVSPTPYTVAAYDIETNTDDDTILMASIAMLEQENSNMEGKLYLAVVESYTETDTEGLQDRIELKLTRLLGPKMDLSKWSIDIEVVKNEIEVVRETIGKAHEWSPDFLAIWNVSFDMGKILECCERWGIDPADIFTDPLLDPKYKYFKWKPGQTVKVTTGGDRRPIPYSDQWHVANCASSFYIIDAMAVYRRLRLAAPLVPGGYSLDNILDRELKERKLKIPEADKYTGLAWHQFMTRNYKDEYIIYNMWDTISMLYLEKKTNDLSINLPMYSGYNEFDTFSSSTRVMGAQIYFYLREKGMVPGTPDPNIENDPLLLGLRGWISTLPATHIVDNGLKVIEEYPECRTNIRAAVFDADAVSSYPSDITALNVSKETCARELISVEGIDKETMRKENMNLIMSGSSEPTYCRSMFGLPTYTDLM